MVLVVVMALSLVGSSFAEEDKSFTYYNAYAFVWELEKIYPEYRIYAKMENSNTLRCWIDPIDARIDIVGSNHNGDIFFRASDIELVKDKVTSEKYNMKVGLYTACEYLSSNLGQFDAEIFGRKLVVIDEASLEEREVF